MGEHVVARNISTVSQAANMRFDGMLPCKALELV